MDRLWTDATHTGHPYKIFSLSLFFRNEGRMVKQGVVGVFAGTTFDPNGKVLLKDVSRVGLAIYAGRLNIHLLKASDLNGKLRGMRS
jgi:hypothetical protein